MIQLVFAVAVSYLIGSILGSLLLGRLTGRVDIRTVGSGNPGSTNALRTQGKLFALGVIVIDVGKGWIAAGVLPALVSHAALASHVTLASPAAPAPQELRAWLPAACGAAVMLGHVYPLWYGFRGGKAVATFVGAVLGLAPVLLIAVLAMWLGVVILSGFVALASMAAAAVLPIAVAWRGGAGHLPLLAFGIFAVTIIVFAHRSNIARMQAGSEPRARRLWLLGRTGSRP
ncbi:MAG: glycerol-3-phosphate 1-O-acyltransferase PlsY [Steroidobacteraceae bacterium]